MLPFYKARLAVSPCFHSLCWAKLTGSLIFNSQTWEWYRFTHLTLPENKHISQNVQLLLFPHTLHAKSHLIRYTFHVMFAHNVRYCLIDFHEIEGNNVFWYCSASWMEGLTKQQYLLVTDCQSSAFNIGRQSIVAFFSVHTISFLKKSEKITVCGAICKTDTGWKASMWRHFGAPPPVTNYPLRTEGICFQLIDG